MCECNESEARPCGLVNRVKSWFAGPAGPEPGPDRPDWLDDADEVERRQRIVHHEHVARCLAEGITLCARCEQPLDPDDREDGGPIRPDWCWTCSTMWMEASILRPLVARLGRRGARRALRRLVREVQRLV